MAPRPVRRSARAFNDEEIAEILNNSDFDDSGGEDEYQPLIQESNHELSSSESEVDDNEESGRGARGGRRRDQSSSQAHGRGSSRARGRGRGRSSSIQSRGRGKGSRSQGNSSGTPARTPACSQNADSGPEIEGSDSDQEQITDEQIVQAAEWHEDNDICFENTSLIEPAYLPFDDSAFSSIFDYIKHYIDNNIYELITEKSNQSYLNNNGRTLNLTVKETKTFVGLTLLMACINYPILRMYWETKWRINIIANAMSRDRFFIVRNALKLVYDDDVPVQERQKDLLWKVRPIFESVLKGCHKQVPEQQVSVDEMIIPFSGACGMKQYCPNKPNPVGLKAFILANPNGVVCNMVIYQGKTTFPSYTEAGYGLGESAVLLLTENLVPGTIVYHDRYFSTIKLANNLLSRGIKCAGTLIKNRIPAQARDLLASDQSLKKRGRGSYQVLCNTKKTLAITKWMDNKPVLMMSTAHAATETDVCSRWCKKEKKYIPVTRPAVIKQYNSKMGGVDMADRLLAVCPARSRTRKWTVRFMSHMIDLALSNSWLLYKTAELAKGTPLKKILQLRAYKMRLAENLIEENTLPDLQDYNSENEAERSLKRTPGRRGEVPIPSKRRRFYGNMHMPQLLDKQQRCRRETCDKKSTINCGNCNVALCLNAARNCFLEFHNG